MHEHLVADAALPVGKGFLVAVTPFERFDVGFRRKSHVGARRAEEEHSVQECDDSEHVAIINFPAIHLVERMRHVDPFDLKPFQLRVDQDSLGP
jgi:hypothetical protein